MKKYILCGLASLVGVACLLLCFAPVKKVETWLDLNEFKTEEVRFVCGIEVGRIQSEMRRVEGFAPDHEVYFLGTYKRGTLMDSWKSLGRFDENMHSTPKAKSLNLAMAEFLYGDKAKAKRMVSAL